MTSQPLDGMRIAFIATDGVEAVEMSEPWTALVEAGAVPTLLSIDSGTIQGFDHLTPSTTFPVDNSVSHAHADDYRALVLPGGVANPDRLRTDEPVVDFVRATAEAGTPIGVICHGPWTLVSAGLVEGRRLTSWPSLRDDLVNAGADWVDEEVVVDESDPNVIISSRKPDDLPAFCKNLVEHFQTS